MSDVKENQIFTRAQLQALIWPLFLEQFLSVSMGFVDTFMVSGVSEAAVSSVSLVDNINILITQVLSALATGGAVVTSQFLGHKDVSFAKRSVAQLFSILTVSTLLVMGAALLFTRPILRLVFGSIDDNVMDFAQTYFYITAISYPFIGLYNGGAAIFRAQGDSKISMKASLVMNVINIVGNAVLIYGCKLGVLGAAAATLAGRVLAAVWILLKTQRKENMLRIDGIRQLKPERDLMRRILGIGIPSGLENGMFQIGKLCVSSLVSTLGTAAIAANAVANSISGIANIPGNTMGLATIPVIGRCLGAGEKKQAKGYAYLLMGIAMGGLFVTNVLLFFFIPEISGWFHLSGEASALCIRVIRYFDVFSIFAWATSFTLPNVLRAGGDAKYTMLVSILSMWCFRVILSLFFVKSMGMGLLGVWMGMFIDWCVRSLCFGVRFFHGKWMEHKII
ncbi:MAG: MATE family efflux transporter [Clostridiales bacterium]|nr:MATE family efflux transporter [Clostridiales bacterium]